MTTGERVEGIDEQRVTRWFEENAPEVSPPLRFDLITGGHSNLTFEVTDRSGHRWVLRRPPLGHVLATAHDMGREHAVISALGPTPVPVPPVVGLCQDDDVNGAPFYVMGFVEGTVVRSGVEAAELTDEQRVRASQSIVDVLAEIHAVDVDAVGLGELGRKEGYIERQLKRWYGQWESSKTRELPVIDQVHDELSKRVPDQGPATIVHGDYRLDNCMVQESGDIVAVLDWEICTLGDPLADLGLLMVYWAEPGDEHKVSGAPTAVPGFLSKQELLDGYAAASGRDLSAIDFYTAFGYWKLACIAEGVYARYIAGAMSSDGPPDGAEIFAQMVEVLGRLAAERVEAL